uniref:Serpentine Receptor, class T n=1 Tax=Panagrolaimus sp. JU765 TaxID=591449 RepID=A0AC34Q2T7_9BILA
MEKLLWKKSEFEIYYNCSGRTFQEWAQYGHPNAPIGGFYLALGTFYMLLMMPFMIVFIKTDLTKYSCYKIMFSLGICDVIGILIASFFAGFGSLTGNVFCLFPIMNYIAGCIGLAIWVASSSLCILLALNRCIDVIGLKLGNLLFDGKKTYIWISICIIYSLWFLFFNNPSLFNSNFHAFIFDPYVGTPERNGGIDIVNYPHVGMSLHDIIVPIVLILLYFMLCVYIAIKSKMAVAVKISKMQRQTFIQSTLICSATLITSFIYVYMQYFPTPYWLSLFGQFSWQLCHGAAGLSYAFLNETMRREAKYLYCPKSRQKNIKIASSSDVHTK